MSTNIKNKAPLTDDARKALVDVEPSVRKMVVNWLASYMDAEGIDTLSLSDVSVAINRVLTSLDHAALIDTGEIESNQVAELIGRGEVTTLREFLNARAVA